MHDGVEVYRSQAGNDEQCHKDDSWRPYPGRANKVVLECRLERIVGEHVNKRSKERGHGKRDRKEDHVRP